MGSSAAVGKTWQVFVLTFSCHKSWWWLGQTEHHCSGIIIKFIIKGLWHEKDCSFCVKLWCWGFQSVYYIFGGPQVEVSPSTMRFLWYYTRTLQRPGICDMRDSNRGVLPQKSVALLMSHHISNHWAATSPHWAPTSPTNYPPHLQLLSHHISNYWAATSPMSHNISFFLWICPFKVYYL